ncbi:MAG TPA: hypothetical protein P5077_07140 [bacterium]|nr:hypothetical protein [bacterium]
MRNIPIRHDLSALVGFALSAFFAFRDGWTLPEFCWSAWLAGLFFSYACVVVAPVQIILFSGREITRLRDRITQLERVPDGALRAGMIVVALVIGGVSFYVYSYLFGFYGIFLSVFAEMEPLTFFGRNGFINSDFYTPVVYLAERFWPMVAGALIGNAALLLGPDPWGKAVMPFKSKQIVRIHVMVVLMPLITLAVWAVVGDRYHFPVIVLLMVLFYLIPEGSRRRPEAG